MPSSTEKSAFFKGFRDGLPFLFILIPFAVLFGAIGSEAGLNVAEVMGFTVLVIAGAAQFTAVQLLIENAPVFTVIATALAVNLRMAMYSAAMVPHLGGLPFWKRAVAAYVLVDQVYAASVLTFEDRAEMTAPDKFAYFVGMGSLVAPVWFAATFAGAVGGALLPQSLDLTITLPITFLALVGPALRTLAHIAAALTSIVLALALSGLPAGTGLLVAGAVAMAVGAQVELWQGRRA